MIEKYVIDKISATVYNISFCKNCGRVMMVNEDGSKQCPYCNSTDFIVKEITSISQFNNLPDCLSEKGHRWITTHFERNRWGHRIWTEICVNCGVVADFDSGD